jgi:c-di-GMP-related signal transduction protein
MDITRLTQFFYILVRDYVAAGIPKAILQNHCPVDTDFSYSSESLRSFAEALAYSFIPSKNYPTIVCLCGSTKFYKEFQKANYQETGKGSIVLTVGFFMHSPEVVHGQTLGIKLPEQKIMLDELHKRKIDLCDEVFVIDEGLHFSIPVLPYIGNSTRSEIEYAQKLGKKIRYLSVEGWSI